MRLLYLCDTQLRVRPPENRLDLYGISMLRKLWEISHIASDPNNKVDAIIHGGDFFDGPRVTPDYVGQVVEIIKMSGKPWYVVPGN